MIRFLSLFFVFALGNAHILESTAPTGLCDTTKQLSGYFKLGKQNKSYFYWFFEARESPETAPLVLWMTGGPGCSSEVALFGENGPCKVNSDGKTTSINPNSWNKKANMIYIDQPAGTGYSYGTHDTNEKEVGEDMYEFLQAFLKANPQYIKSSEFYVFGESYAGHYVPATSHRIFAGNNALKSGDVHIPLAGLAIGNGLTDPEIQYSAYPKMACNSGTAPHVPGFATPGKGLCKAMEDAVPGCIKSITSCNKGSTLSCGSAYLKCNEALVTPVELSGINLYDLREKCQHPPLCYDFSLVKTFLDQDSVKEKLGVKGHSWSDCNHLVTIGFLGDWMKDYQNLIPDMLEAGIKVLVYAGDQDYICNWIGNKAWTLALPWSGHDAFNAAKDSSWQVAGSKAGLARTAKNFTFLQVFQAGHMVPRDQPVNALAMLETFVTGGSFTSAAPTKIVSMNAVKDSALTDVLEVFEGIVTALVGENGGNVKQCKVDATNTWSDLTRAYGDFKVAFTQEKTKKSVETAMVALSDVVADFVSAGMDCGQALAKVAKEVEAIVKKLQQPKGWLQVVEGEALKVLKHHTDMTKDAKAIYADFEEKNYEQMGESIGKIINILLTPETVTFIGAESWEEEEFAVEHYEDPNTTGSCSSGEVVVQVQGVKGKFCSPQCKANSCPTDVPTGVTAKPQCALQGFGTKYCALICAPSTDVRSLRAGDSQCGQNASCKAISGVGICTYDK